MTPACHPPLSSGRYWSRDQEEETGGERKRKREGNWDITGGRWMEREGGGWKERESERQKKMERKSMGREGDREEEGEGEGGSGRGREGNTESFHYLTRLLCSC